MVRAVRLSGQRHATRRLRMGRAAAPTPALEPCKFRHNGAPTARQSTSGRSSRYLPTPPTSTSTGTETTDASAPARGMSARTGVMYKQRYYPAGFLMRRFVFILFSDKGRATLRHFPFS